MKIWKFLAYVLSISYVVAHSLTCLGASRDSGGSLVNLTADRRATKVGDLLFVQVLENSSASTSADTTTERKSGVGLGVRFPNTTKQANIDFDADYSGKGKIQRSGKVLAQLSVIVIEVEESGLLRVSGRQVIDVNGEKQEIELSGRVRPEDVQDGNSVVSTKIADAHIRYVGDGVLGEQQRPGILTRFLAWLGII